MLQGFSDFSEPSYMFGLREVPAKAFVTQISFKRLHARHHQLWLPATASWPFLPLRMKLKLGESSQEPPSFCSAGQ